MDRLFVQNLEECVQLKIFKFERKKERNRVESETKLFGSNTLFTHLSFPLLVAGLEASDEDDDGDDDRGHDRSRGRNDNVVELLAASNAFSSDLTALVVGNVVWIDGNVF